MNPRQRRAVLLLALAVAGLLGVFALIVNYVSDVETQVGDKVVVLELAKPAKANEAITDDMVTEKTVPKRWAPGAALRDRTQLVGYVAAADIEAKSVLQEGMLVTPPEISQGEREVAILVDAATGVAGKISPGRQVDVIASYGAVPADPENGIKSEPARSIVIVPGAKVIAVGTPREKPAQQRPGGPAGAGDRRPRHVRALQEAGAAGGARPGVRAGRPARAAAPRRPARPHAGRDHLQGRGPEARRRGGHRVSARLLIAVADDETARRAAAQAREAELEVADIVIDPEEVHRALRRLDVDVVLLHDALGGTPVLDLARELSSAFPEVGLILLAAEDTPGLLRAAMQAGFRDVVALPLALESFEASVRAASQWSRTMRDRVTGEESAGASLGGQLVVVAGAKGGVGTTTVALHLGMAAARMAPGRPVCLVDFDLQKGDFRALLDTPHRRSVVDLVVSPTRSPSGTCRRPCTRTRTASGCCSRPSRASAPRTSTPPSPATSSARSRRGTR